MNNQRMLNKDFGINVHQVSFIADLKLQQVDKIIKTTAEICQTCFTNKKTHYCVQASCKKRQLICFNCEPNSINSSHFQHQYTYVLPLFCKNIFENFIDIQNGLINFEKYVNTQIVKIRNYLQQMESILQKTKEHISFLQKEFQNSNFEKLINSLKEYNGSSKQLILKNVFENIKFYSGQQCVRIQQKIIRELHAEINKLKWLQNPQKQFKLMLELRQQEVKRDLFLSSKKKIQVSEIDHFYKINSEFFTESLRTHKIELKVENDFLNKSKFYEALVYNLKDVQILCIDNAHMNQIRTPLTFRNLKQLQFNCNTESESFNLRIQNISEELRSLKIRKLRQEEIKIIKIIVSNCYNLKQLHIQFYNKSDLCSNKELCELITNLPTSIESIFIKLRTQNEVKRMYGYLSKFNKDTGESHHLNNALQGLIKKNKIIKLVIQGVRPINTQEILNKLEKMENLLYFRIYYDNIDLMGQLDLKRVQELLDLCQERKRLLQIILKAKKQKYLSRRTIKNIIQDLLL